MSYIGRSLSSYPGINSGLRVIHTLEFYYLLLVAIQDVATSIGKAASWHPSGTLSSAASSVASSFSRILYYKQIVPIKCFHFLYQPLHCNQISVFFSLPVLANLMSPIFLYMAILSMCVYRGSSPCTVQSDLFSFLFQCWPT